MEGVRSALSLIEVAFFLGTSVLAALSHGMSVTGILVTKARESGLAVLVPCCLVGEPDVKAATAEPQKDCSCGLVEPPPGKREQQPPGGHERLARQGAVVGRQPPPGDCEQPPR